MGGLVQVSVVKVFFGVDVVVQLREVFLVFFLVLLVEIMGLVVGVVEGEGGGILDVDFFIGGGMMESYDSNGGEGLFVIGSGMV